MKPLERLLVAAAVLIALCPVAPLWLDPPPDFIGFVIHRFTNGRYGGPLPPSAYGRRAAAEPDELPTLDERLKADWERRGITEEMYQRDCEAWENRPLEAPPVSRSILERRTVVYSRFLRRAFLMLRPRFPNRYAAPTQD